MEPFAIGPQANSSVASSRPFAMDLHTPHVYSHPHLYHPRSPRRILPLVQVVILNVANGHFGTRSLLLMLVGIVARRDISILHQINIPITFDLV